MSLISIDYRDRKLIYEQLMDSVKQLILRGGLKKDDFLPSVRSLARELGINPNTIQKAYNELEHQGIIATLPGRGSVVTQDAESIADAGKRALRTELLPIAERALSLGMSMREFTDMAAECWRAGTERTGKERETI